MIRVRQAVIEDATLIGDRLRDADRVEAWRAMGLFAHAAIRESILKSSVCGVFLDDNEPLCIMGLVQPIILAPGIAHPWLVGTEALGHHRKAFLRETRLWVQEWRKDYSLLVNYVDAEYTGAIRWLEWLGFDIFPPEPYGPRGALFRRFEMRS